MSLHRGKVGDCVVTTRIEHGQYRAEVKCGAHHRQYCGPTNGAGVQAIALAVARNFSTRLRAPTLTPAKARKILHDTARGRPFKGTGRPITEAQRRYMGAVSRGGARGNPMWTGRVPRGHAILWSPINQAWLVTYPASAPVDKRMVVKVGSKAAVEDWIQREWGHQFKNPRKGEVGPGWYGGKKEKRKPFIYAAGTHCKICPAQISWETVHKHKDYLCDACFAETKGRKPNASKSRMTPAEITTWIRSHPDAFAYWVRIGHEGAKRGYVEPRYLGARIQAADEWSYLTNAQADGIAASIMGGRKTNHWLVPLAVGVPAGMLLGAAGMHRAMKGGRKSNAAYLDRNGRLHVPCQKCGKVRLYGAHCSCEAAPRRNPDKLGRIRRGEPVWAHHPRGGVVTGFASKTFSMGSPYGMYRYITSTREEAMAGEEGFSAPVSQVYPGEPPAGVKRLNPTKKDYVATAAILRAAPAPCRGPMTDAFARHYAADSPRFDAGRFRAAAGAQGNPGAARCSNCGFDVPRAGRGLARHRNPRSGAECRGNPLSDHGDQQPAGPHQEEGRLLRLAAMDVKNATRANSHKRNPLDSHRQGCMCWFHKKQRGVA